MIIILITLSLCLCSNSIVNKEDDDGGKEWSGDWISLLLVPLCSVGIFGLYTMNLRHRLPWSLLYRTAVSFSALLPTLFTILGHVRFPWLMKSIFYCLRTRRRLSRVERVLMRRLWMVSGGFVGMGAASGGLLLRSGRLGRDMKRIVLYYSLSVIGLGLMGLLTATCLTLSLSKAVRQQIIMSFSLD